ncbi:pyruvate, water dikinase regulatory protein [Halanaerobaculum tunisiense]
MVIFIISDSTGKTAETVVDAVVSQFNPDTIEIRKFNKITNMNKLTKVVDRVKKEQKVILIYTLIKPELCNYIEDKAEKFNIPVIDIMGSIISKFTQVLNDSPQLEPGLNHKIDNKYFERIDCIEFTVNCDDGQCIERLGEADIVLIGISRTSKTPLSMYLAHQGYKVANIPLIPKVSPPVKLYRLSSDKIVGLTIDPMALQQVRTERVKEMNFNYQSDYTQMSKILDEISFAEKIINDIGDMKINVTNKSIEEVASKILSNKSFL